jgi:hypothetical protein
MYWLAKELVNALGGKGILVFVIVLAAWPFAALWVAVSQRVPALLLGIPAWVVFVGVPSGWFTNPLDPGPLFFVGPVVYFLCWLLIVGSSFLIAKELSSRSN